jgi:class 3 adenylate cyclase/tetratricopeptide (TPR) repeat protein
VTVVFTDIVGSTQLAEKLDPESLHGVMTRYFEDMQAVLTRHGGVTEKFVGDAILAAFGVPRAHEDDALRAVRAAAEMRDRLQELNDSLMTRHGVEIQTRTGVNTGEVVTGDPEGGSAFVTGDPVNVAARLEQAASPGEILISDSTHRLITGAATAEPVPPLQLKGKADPIAAWRLLEVATGTGRWDQPFDSILVGRSAELGALRGAFRDVVDARRCASVTIVGPAGVGKSRLTAEFLATVGDGVLVLRGRCLPYGEGITFWPIIEVLRSATRVSEFDPPEKAVPALAQLLNADASSASAADHLAALMGMGTKMPDIHETFWSVRKLLEETGSRGPTVVVFDDIEWAEPTFLDLIEYLNEWLVSVPVLFMCLARPELLDQRQAWLSGSKMVRLEPLSKAETVELVRNLLGGVDAPDEVTERIAETTEGNPLFVEETVRMLVDDGTLRRESDSWRIATALSDVSIPPTIQALLTARVDMLEEGERRLIERASVIGRVFWWSAVAELTPEQDRSSIGGWLQSLVHKQLLSPDLSQHEEDAFRFTHILVRDAAYRGIPKATRAQLHESFARWLAARQPASNENEEIVGYHLEHAYASLRELGPIDDRIEELGRAAAEPLASAGRRAFARGDMSAAANLFSRTVTVSPAGERIGTEVLPDLAVALLETGSFDRSRAVLDRLRAAADRADDDVLTANAIVIDLWIRLFTQPEGWAVDVEREARRAMSMFEEVRDDRGLAKGWTLLALSHMLQGRFSAAADAWEQAADHASITGDRREELEDLSWVPIAAWCGPATVDASIRRCEAIVRRAGGDRKTTAIALATIGTLEAMRGRFSEARSLAARANALMEEVNLPGWKGALTQLSGWIELFAGDAAAAEQELRVGVEILRGIGELSWLSSTAAILAEALYERGDVEGADALTRESEAAAGPEDIYSQALLRSVRAKIFAGSREPQEAEGVAREAISLADGSDFTFLQVVTRIALGKVLETAGRSDEAYHVYSEAVDLSEAIGFTVGVGWGHAAAPRPRL